MVRVIGVWWRRQVRQVGVVRVFAVNQSLTEPRYIRGIRLALSGGVFLRWRVLGF